MFHSFCIKRFSQKKNGCVHSLLANFISSWDGFIRVFLRKYFPDDKTVKLRNENNHFVKLEKESIWKCFEWFKLLLAQYPHDGLEGWCLCQIIYEDLDQATGTMVGSMCQGGFLNKSETKGWDFLEELVEKTLQWETSRDEGLHARTNSQMVGVHMVVDTTYIYTRFVTLENMLKGFMLSQTLNNLSPPRMVSCSRCSSTDYSPSTCPLFAQELVTSPKQGQVNTTFQRPKFNPYSPTYNARWA